MKSNRQKNTKIALKIYLPWQDENEEKWLEKLSANGWQLGSAIPFFYKFRKCSPKQITIRLDYKNTWDKDYQDYLNIFSDAGWTLLTTLGNWHYFSTNPQNEVVPEIYNSNRAKAIKYRRLALGLAPFLLLVASPLVHALDFSTNPPTTGLELAQKTIYLFTALLFIYSFLRVCIKLIQLKINHRE